MTKKQRQKLVKKLREDLDRLIASLKQKNQLEVNEITEIDKKRGRFRNKRKKKNDIMQLMDSAIKGMNSSSSSSLEQTQTDDMDDELNLFYR